MPASSPNPRPEQLATTARRALGSTMVTGATGLPSLVAATLVDGLDAALGAALCSAGMTIREARIIATSIWTDR